ncbi:MAG TPA: serine/threonine-protein kinase [Terriglobales bacterium]|jgi:serine/threonine-protein kinase
MPVVCPAPEKITPPKGLKTRTRVPTELLGKTSSRLYWLAIVVLVSTIILFLVRHFFDPDLRAIEKQITFLLDIGLLVVTSLTIILIHRLGFLPANRVLELGLLYEVAVGFGLATMEFTRAQLGGQSSIGASSLGMWILAFGIFVPNTPVRALIGAIITAGAGPASYVLSRGFLKIDPWDGSALVLWFAPTFLMAGWTFFLSRDMFHMEVEIRDAREMGSYSLERLLGKGGMGEVWAARHRRLCSGAAIKLIRPEVLIQKTGREAHVIRRRFEQEARATAHLRSPHTVALHDFGVSEDGSFYYAMELLEGLDLEQLVDRFGPQPAPRIMRILRQVCDSLSEAHNYGLIHRDIKPSNVYLARLGVTCDFVKVLDFGLVKAESTNNSRLTLDGTTAGTPAYMAPELATGAAFDGRADIYSLGCVGYFLLTGLPVFEESTPVAIAVAHVQKNPVRPSQRTELPVPAALEELIMRCLAKTPADRPQSAAELARALAALDGVVPWSYDDAERWWRINLPEYFAAEESHVAEALSTAN